MSRCCRMEYVCALWLARKEVFYVPGHSPPNKWISCHFEQVDAKMMLMHSQGHLKMYYISKTAVTLLLIKLASVIIIMMRGVWRVGIYHSRYIPLGYSVFWTAMRAKLRAKEKKSCRAKKRKQGKRMRSLVLYTYVSYECARGCFITNYIMNIHNKHHEHKRYTCAVFLKQVALGNHQRNTLGIRKRYISDVDAVTVTSLLRWLLLTV